VVNPQKLTMKTLPEFIAHVKANPGKLNYGHAGIGTTHHMAGELFKLLTQTNIRDVPYRGAGPMMADLVGGQVEMAFDGLGSSASQIGGGTIRALAVASPQRVKAFPDLPTAAEAGVPNFEVATWYALWAPKGTPAEIVARMTQELQTALAAPSIKEAWEKNGSDVPAVTGAEFASFVSSEIARWGKVVKDAGVKLEAAFRRTARLGTPDRAGRFGEPPPRLLLDLRRQALAHAGVIGVEPGDLLSGHQRRLDEREIDRGQRQGLEPHHLALAARDRARLDQDEVLDPDPVGAGLVIAGLVRKDHAALERGRAGLGDALRALMHRKITADPMAGAVVEIEPALPQGHAGETVDLRPRGAPSGRPLGRWRYGPSAPA
jgi:hypothetical protein